MQEILEGENNWKDQNGKDSGYRQKTPKSNANLNTLHHSTINYRHVHKKFTIKAVVLFDIPIKFNDSSNRTVGHCSLRGTNSFVLKLGFGYICDAKFAVNLSFTVHECVLIHQFIT